jgi:hypothetical protein
MTTTRVALIVLVLLAVLFVVGVGMGAHFNGQGKSICDENSKGDDCADNCEKAACIPQWTGHLGETFASLRPRLEITDLSDSDRRVLLGRIQPSRPITITIPAAESSMFKPSTRTATIQLTRGLAAVIVFSAAAPEEVERELRQQELKLPREADKAEDRVQGSLAITKKGGSLLITCEGLTPCELELK